MTTPIKIQNNGITIITDDENKNITITPNDGIKLQYDNNTSNPKTFTISSTGFNFSDNTNNYTSSLLSLSLSQLVLNALTIPINPLTLQVRKFLRLTNDTDYTDIGINNTGNAEISGTKNLEISKLTVFNVVPTCPTLPTAGIQLVNKNYVDRIGTNLYNSSTSLFNGVPNGELINNTCSITLTSGTWMVQAQMTMLNTITQDSALIYLYNLTTSSAVPNSKGACGFSTTTNYNLFVSNNTIITVSSNTNICPAGTRNGVSTLQVPSANICGGPNAIITAIRLF